MNTFTRIAVAALATAGLLLPLSMTPVQPAAAGCDPNISIFGCEQHVITATVCWVDSGSVVVTNTISEPNYVYDLYCTHHPPIHANTAYDVATKTAYEYLTTDTAQLQAQWTCPADPWSTTTAMKCSGSQITNSSGNEFTEFILGRQATTPYSLLFLDASSRQVLGPQLLRGLDEAAKEAAKQAAILSSIEVTSIGASSCAICSALGNTPAPAPTPSLPDLKIMAVRAVAPKPDPATSGELLSNGMTAGYEVVVVNLGSRMPQALDGAQSRFQVSIQVTGAVQYSSMTQTPAGWDCSGKGPVTCTGAIGGYGDAVQDTVVTFRLQILGVKIGAGAISATADPNNLFKDSDLTNNAKTLAITVK
jgi:hypothetical protein